MYELDLYVFLHMFLLKLGNAMEESNKNNRIWSNYKKMEQQNK
jgi:hypothetical protein